jgi:hypothetical protein
MPIKSRTSEIATLLKKAGISNISVDETIIDGLQKFTVLKQVLPKLPSSLLTQDNFDALIQCSEISSFHLILDLLKKSKQLMLFSTQEHFDVFINKDKDSWLETTLGFTRLERSAVIRHLTQENFDIFLKHAHLRQLNAISSQLHSIRRLTPNNFKQLLTLRDDNYLYTSAICSRIPEHLLTQEIFDQLIEHAQGDNAQQALHEYVDNLLEEIGNNIPIGNNVGIRRRNNYINNEQSTHTASAHKTASESIKRLDDLYKTKIEGEIALDKTIKEIKKYLATLERSPEKETAQRCIKRITATDYTFYDPGSGCSVKQSLALTFLAIHDDTSRSATLEDAQASFIEGLCEIQRGYNKNSRRIHYLFLDLFLALIPALKNYFDYTDKPICPGGTLNKLVEKLCGIHPDANINFITLETATLKLPIVIVDEAKKYLAANPETDPGNTDSLFENIKDKVTESMLTEFKSVLDTLESDELISFINSGEYALEQALEENKFKKEIEEFQKSKERHAPPTNSIGRPGFFAAGNQAQSTSQEHNSHDTENYNKSVKRL